MKVGGAPAQSKSGAPIRRKAPENNFFWSYPSTFSGCESIITRFGERFCDGQYSLVSFLFAVLLLMASPRAQPFVKVGDARVPVSNGVGATGDRITSASQRSLVVK